jgi:hypothetical protein
VRLVILEFDVLVYSGFLFSLYPFDSHVFGMKHGLLNVPMERHTHSRCFSLV